MNKFFDSIIARFNRAKQTTSGLRSKGAPHLSRFKMMVDDIKKLAKNSLTGKNWHFIGYAIVIVAIVGILFAIAYFGVKAAASVASISLLWVVLGIIFVLCLFGTLMERKKPKAEKNNWHYGLIGVSAIVLLLFATPKVYNLLTSSITGLPSENWLIGIVSAIALAGIVWALYRSRSSETAKKFAVHMGKAAMWSILAGVVVFFFGRFFNLSAWDDLAICWPFLMLVPAASLLYSFIGDDVKKLTNWTIRLAVVFSCVWIFWTKYQEAWERQQASSPPVTKLAWTMVKPCVVNGQVDPSHKHRNKAKFIDYDDEKINFVVYFKGDSCAERAQVFFWNKRRNSNWGEWQQTDPEASGRFDLERIDKNRFLGHFYWGDGQTGTCDFELIAGN